MKCPKCKEGCEHCDNTGNVPIGSMWMLELQGLRLPAVFRIFKGNEVFFTDEPVCGKPVYRLTDEHSGSFPETCGYNNKSKLFICINPSHAALDLSKISEMTHNSQYLFLTGYDGHTWKIDYKSSYNQQEYLYLDYQEIQTILNKLHRGGE
ncbi:MAG TPA: hypothetical protein VMX17_03420 [Candidatus Glassbacteria bacterium]|nr:hypothetical protein [Candidatus Glassbacteria bacterium]